MSAKSDASAEGFAASLFPAACVAVVSTPAMATANKATAHARDTTRCNERQGSWACLTKTTFIGPAETVKRICYTQSLSARHLDASHVKCAALQRKRPAALTLQAFVNKSIKNVFFRFKRECRRPCRQSRKARAGAAGPWRGPGAERAGPDAGRGLAAAARVRRGAGHPGRRRSDALEDVRDGVLHGPRRGDG